MLNLYNYILFLSESGRISKYMHLDLSESLVDAEKYAKL